MGGGNKRDRPDRASEYRDREPDDDTAETAQTRLDTFSASDLTGAESEGEADEEAEADAIPDERVEADATGGDEAEADMDGERADEAAAATEDDGSGSGESEGVDVDAFDDPNEAARHLGPTDEQSIPVDLGPTDPETVEEEFGVDLDETQTVQNIHRSDTDHEYDTMTYRSRHSVENALSEKHGEDVWDDMDELIGSWKGGKDKRDKQTLELIAKKANGIGRPVRRDGEKAREIEPDDPRIDAYRDLTRISQAFTKANLVDGDDDGDGDADGSLTVHRGVRMANESLTAQFIDDPDADAYRVETSATSNHSTDEGVSEAWGDPYTITHEIEPDDVTLAIDHVRVAGLSEAELHIDSDDVTVSPDGIGFSATKNLHGDHETVDDVFDTFDDPESATDKEHRDVRDLMGSMNERGETPRTDAGAQNMIDYFDGVMKNDDVNKHKAERTRKIVDGTLDEMDTDLSVRSDSATMGAIRNPEAASPDEHRQMTEYISPYTYDGMRDGHVDEDAEELVDWVDYLADEKPMDDRELRSAHRHVEKVLEEADTDVEIEIDRLDMTR